MTSGAVTRISLTRISFALVKVLHCYHLEVIVLWCIDYNAVVVDTVRDVTVDLSWERLGLS